MPANNFSFITSLSGGPISESAPSVGISFERCSTTNPDPPFTAPGDTLQVFINFQWRLMAIERTVQGFTNGDIQVIVEDDPELEERIELGHINRGGVAIGSLIGGSNGEYTLPITLNPNSAGTVSVTVFANAASTIPIIGRDTMPVYGPLEPLTVSFGYSTLSGTLPTIIKPIVDIDVPEAPIFTETSTTIRFIWNSEIRERDDRSIGPDDDDDIKITGTGVTYDATAFTHTGNEMTLPITLTGQSECTIRVKQDSEIDDGGQTGPPIDVTESFLFDTGLTAGTVTGTLPSGNPVVIYDSGDQAFNSTSDPMLGTNGGAFKGVSDLKLIDGNFYGTVQIQKRTQSNILDQGEISKAVLFRIPNQTSARATILKQFDSMDDAPRSLTKFGERLYFFQGSYHREDVNPGPEAGQLQSVSLTGTSVTSSGVPWRSRLFNPNSVNQRDNVTYSRHIQMGSPMVAVDNNLYLNCGYGNTMSIKSTDWESSENQEGLDAPETRIDNWALLKYGNIFEFRPPVVLTNGKTSYDVIQELAELCFSYIGFDGNTFILRPKFQPKAQLTNGILESDTPSTLLYHSANMLFPNEGFIRIAGQTNPWEIFEYNARDPNNNRFTGVIRALYETVADEHCPNSTIEFIDHVIDMEEASYSERPINLLNIRQDLQQLYNIITINYGSEILNNEETSRHEQSIRNNKPRKLELSIALDHHNSEWVAWLADRYRDFYGPVKSIIELQLKPSFFIKTGQFILLREKRNSLINDKIFQVLRVTHSVKPYLTNIQLRSIG